MTTQNPDFIPGMQLSRMFYSEAVRPILDERFPGLKHSAALIGSGSEVLGFDDRMSSDHHWGPRVLLFLGEEDFRRQASSIHATLANRLPVAFRGYSTHFTPPDPNDSGTQLLQAIEHGPVNHRVETLTIRSFFLEQLAFEIERPVEPADWLSFSEQHLLEVTGGAVFHDELGLEEQRARFDYYPRDVWLYLLAAAWARIGQEEHLMGRAGIAGDEIGSALIGARLVRDVIRLCFLLEKKYVPYAKWLGTAFKELECADDLWPVLQDCLHARSWQERDQLLAQAYEYIAARHNALQISAPLPEKTRQFFGRPLRVIALHGYASATLGAISDPQVKRIAAMPLIGSLDLFSDNTDLVSNASWRPALRRLFEE